MRKTIEIPPVPVNKVLVGIDSDGSETPARLLARAAVAHAKSGGSLKDRDLSGADFTEERLDHIDFSGAVLTRARFAESKLRGCLFNGCEISEVDFFDAHLQNVSMKNAFGDDVDMRCALFENCDLERLEMFRPRLAGVKLALTNCKNIKVTCPVVDAPLIFKNCNLAGASFSDGEVAYLVIDNSGSRHASSYGGNRMRFNNFKINGGRFSNLDMRDSEFASVSIKNVDFMSCQALGSNFQRFDARDCKFVGGDFSYTYWGSSVLDGGAFTGLEMSDPNITDMTFQNGVDIVDVKFRGLRQVAPRFVRSSISACNFENIDVDELVFDDCHVDSKVVFNQGRIGKFICDETKFEADTASVKNVEREYTSRVDHGM